LPLLNQEIFKVLFLFHSANEIKLYMSEMYSLVWLTRQLRIATSKT